MVYSNVLEAMGNTPLIKLSKIVESDSADVLVKYEGVNIGGSIKTRTAYNMVVTAEKAGIIKNGSATIIAKDNQGYSVIEKIAKNEALKPLSSSAF